MHPFLKVSACIRKCYADLLPVLKAQPSEVLAVLCDFVAVPLQPLVALNKGTGSAPPCSPLAALTALLLETCCALMHCSLLLHQARGAAAGRPFPAH